MSCSPCCTRCAEWCASVCCPGLPREKSGKASPYPNIQYSLVASQAGEEKPTQRAQPQRPSSTDRERPGSTSPLASYEATSPLAQQQVPPVTGGGHEVVEPSTRGQHRRPPRPKMRFRLQQHGSQFTLHPQLGISFGENYPVTDQPSPDRFLQRFRLYSDSGSAPQSPDIRTVMSTTRTTAGPIRVQTGSSLPVYREKSLRVDVGDGEPEPTVQFSIHYDIHQSKLRVHLQHASNLPRHTSKGRQVRCDSFVMIHLEPDREDTLQSEVVRDSHDPEFDQTFQFGGLSVENIKLQSLVFRFYNHASNNRAIGKAHLPLRDVDLFGVIVQMKVARSDEMESNFQGDLLISLSYSPVSRNLSGIISKATGLRRHDLLGKADPYIKVIITFKEETVFKWKTSVKRHTLSPIYNENFNYEVSEEMGMAMDSITISFYVVDFDYVLRNDTMGVVTVGKNVKNKLGRRHWNQVLQSPRQGVSFWHPVQLATSAQKRHMRSRSNSPLPQ